MKALKVFTRQLLLNVWRHCRWTTTPSHKLSGHWHRAES